MMNSSWNIDGNASQYKTYEKGWANKEDAPAAGAGGSRKPGIGTYQGPSKKATGKATMYSGVQSADNPFTNATSYYDGKDVPQRKSIAYQQPKASKNYNYTETPGQQSNESSMYL